jgi:hypothetical protein
LQPDPEAYERVMEPHARGSLLVAAVFDAFLTIYRARAADLLRIATRGTGVLPAGQLHPDLIRRLATEAAASAQEVLDMCIRALDYCPPVDITFGDYLRAIVTADREFDPIDERRRRIAFVEAFRRHGILPEGVRTFALEGLYWPPDEPLPDQALQEVQKYIDQWTSNIESWNLTEDREQLYNLMDSMREKLHWFLNEPAIRPTLDFIDPDLPFEVHALRPSTRIDLLGKRHFQWIFEVTQWLPDFYDMAQACAFDDGMCTASASTKTKLRDEAGGDYRFRGGSTVIVDVETGGVLFGIRKPIGDQRRRKRQRDYRSGLASQSMRAIYFRNGDNREPFAALHRF